MQEIGNYVVEKRKCAVCGKDLSDDAKFCLYCGAMVPTEKETAKEESIQTVFCIKCGEQIKSITHFCPKCGAAVIPIKDKVQENVKMEPLPKRYCTKCGEEVNPNLSYCPKCETPLYQDENSKRDEAAQDEPKVRTLAGIIGFLGTVITTMGMFMPYIEMWNHKISYFTGMTDSDELGSAVFFWLVIFGIGLECMLFLKEQNAAGNVIGGVLLILLLLQTFGSDSSDRLSDYLSYGFWVMCIGLVLMTISSVFHSKEIRH